MKMCEGTCGGPIEEGRSNSVLRCRPCAKAHIKEKLAAKMRRWRLLNAEHYQAQERLRYQRSERHTAAIQAREQKTARKRAAVLERLDPSGLTIQDRERACLGMSVSGAHRRLQRMLLFQFLVDANETQCCHCHQPMTVDDFSIEHLKPWRGEPDGKQLFFDLRNIAFAHTRCNTEKARMGRRLYPLEMLGNLTHEQVREIQRLRDACVPVDVLATQFGVSTSIIYRVS